MHLSAVTWTDADAVETDLAVLPVGSTEQHGPHAPLGTDVLTAEAVVRAGTAVFEDNTGTDVIVAPAIPVGVAEEHRQFTGTLWVSEHTFREYVAETIESLISHGWNRIVVVNGHGGNVSPLREVCGRITRQTTGYAVPFTWFDAIDIDTDTDIDSSTDIDSNSEENSIQMGHGGPVETSFLRSTHPDLVREDRTDDAATNGADGWGEWQSGTNLAYDTAEFSENGTVGDPRNGGSTLGEQLRDDAADELARLLERVANRPLEQPPHR